MLPVPPKKKGKSTEILELPDVLERVMNFFVGLLTTLPRRKRKFSLSNKPEKLLNANS